MLSNKILHSADMLLPKNIDFSKWSVVACDQYTSQPDYWDKLESFVSDSPSTLRLTLPEIHLEGGDTSSLVKNINKNMNSYLANDVFETFEDAVIYTRRTMPNGKVREGIVAAVDLECYTFEPGSSGTVRATEGTDQTRIPPRVKIRKDAPLELPHIMLLVDDIKDQLFSYLRSHCESFRLVYDFDLSMGGGHIKGYIVSADGQNYIDDFINKKNTGVNPLVFAVGDGNHSLATAKACYQSATAGLSEAEKAVHPSRFALCETVDLGGESLEFEPIHRAVFSVDEQHLENYLVNSLGLSKTDNDTAPITVVSGDVKKLYYITKPCHTLAVGSVQMALDDYMATKGGRCDYIHGDDTVYDLAKGKGVLGILVPGIEKPDLFKTVIKNGVLPRKAFSMGHAYEKRYYLEARKIK